MRDKRYSAVISTYVYAANEEEAKEKAKKMTRVINALDDNDAFVYSLKENKFGSK